MLLVPSTITAPATITIVFRTPTFGVDLSSVTAVSLNVLRRDGTSASWAMAIVSATPSELTAQYVFTGTGEITTSGLYYLAPQLTVPGGVFPAEVVAMFVSPSFASSPQLEASAWIVATSVVPSLGPIKNTWVNLTSASSPYQASAASPWLSLDLTNGPITVTLWAANDGDTVVLSDEYAQAATHSATLAAHGADKVPTTGGAYGASTTLSTAGFTVRLKYRSASTLWLPW